MNASLLKNVLSVFDQNKEVEVVDYTTGETIGIVNKVGILDNVIYVTKNS